MSIFKTILIWLVVHVLDANIVIQKVGKNSKGYLQVAPKKGTSVQIIGDDSHNNTLIIK